MEPSKNKPHSVTVTVKQTYLDRTSDTKTFHNVKRVSRSGDDLLLTFESGRTKRLQNAEVRDMNHHTRSEPTNVQPLVEHPVPHAKQKLNDTLHDAGYSFDTSLTVAENRDKLINRIAMNDDWVIFTTPTLDHQQTYYIWNKNSDNGFRVDDGEWVFGSLVEVIQLLTNTIEPTKHENPLEPDGNNVCPYCSNERLQSRELDTGHVEQFCENCKRRRIID